MVKKILGAMIVLFLTAGGSFAAEPIDPVLKSYVPKENVFLPSGTVLRGTIMGAVFSYNVAVPIVINLDEPALCPKNDYVVLPKNTRLLAWGNVLKSDNRVNMSVYRAILPKPSGQEFALDGIVLYPDGTAGVPGERKEYKDAKFMSSAAAGALQGVGQVVTASSGISPIASGAASSMIRTTATDITAATAQRVDVSISIPPQQKVTVFLLERVVFDKGDNVSSFRK